MIDLSVLTDRQREVYLLREDGASYGDIATQLGVSKGTAESAYKRAKKRLKNAPTPTPSEPTPPKAADPAPSTAANADGYVDPWHGVEVTSPEAPADAADLATSADVPTSAPSVTPGAWVAPTFGEDATFAEKYTAELPPADVVNAGKVSIMGGGGHDWSKAPDFGMAKEQAASAFQWAFMTDIPVEQPDGGVAIVSAKLPADSKDKLGQAAAPVLYRLHRAIGNDSGPMSELANLGLVGLSIKGEIASKLAHGDLDMTARPATEAEVAALRGETDKNDG